MMIMYYNQQFMPSFTELVLASNDYLHSSGRHDSATTSDIAAITSRLVDIAIALLALALFAPLMAIIYVAIKWRCPGPALFAQSRIGRGGRYFPCLKFRTMVVNAEARLDHILRTDAAARIEWLRDQKLRHDPRITWLGRFLRKTSLDELPQLVNVLRGEMSIVGPRPIITAEICRYGRAFPAYCRVRPGITGLWQTSGRNNISYRRRVAMDVMYIRRKSVAFDLKLIALTIPAVLLERGSF